jgi:hypothetical protein
LSVRPNHLDIHSGATRVGSALLPASLFRTHELPHDGRFEAWRQSVGVFLDCRLDSRSDTRDFNGQVESYLLDDLMLSRCTANHQKFDRPSLKIARDDIDHYMVQLFLTGGTEMKLGPRSIGGTCLVGFDLADVLDSFNADFDLLCVLVPRARLAPLLRFPDSLNGAMPLTGDGAGALLANFLKDVFEILPTLAPVQAEGVARALIELIAAAFNGAHFPANDVPALAERALQLRTRLHVKARLHERALNPGTSRVRWACRARRSTGCFAIVVASRAISANSVCAAASQSSLAEAAMRRWRKSPIAGALAMLPTSRACSGSGSAARPPKHRSVQPPRWREAITTPASAIAVTRGGSPDSPDAA